MKSLRQCLTSAELDLRTLVWTRANFPLADLASRLKCAAAVAAGDAIVDVSSQPVQATGALRK